MNELTLTLETVTPLFLGGAEPRDKPPELRPPAFRGAMRYWLRAALGGVIGDSNLEELHRLESAVFGAADEKVGASAVLLRLGEQSLNPISYSTLTQYDKQKKLYGRPGLAYLLFAARKTTKEKERSGLVGNFTLHLQKRAGIKNADEHFQEAYAALWLLINLGGLGSRARRGAGNLRVTNATGDVGILKALSLAIRANTPQELANELGNGIKQCREVIVKTRTQQTIASPSAFDVLHPSVCKLWVVNKSFEKWEEALDEIGKVYQGFRKQRAPDYQTVKAAMTGNQKTLTQAVGRAVLGLPIQFYYRSLNGATAGLESEEHDRRASPFLLHVTRLANGKYAVVLLWFHAVFLPPGERLKLHNRNISVTGNPPDDGLVSIFITKSDPTNRSSLKDKGYSVIEVSYD